MPPQRFPAHLEYEKDKNVQKDVICHILSWAKNQPHLPHMTEEDVILFLTSCEYSTEVTKQTIDNYYTYRTYIPELFQDRDPAVKDSFIDNTCGLNIVLPGLTDEGYKAVILKVSTSDMSKYNVVTEVKTFMCCQDQMLFDEGAQKGWRLIIDMADTPFSVVTRISPSLIKKTSLYFMDATPIQLKGLHLVHPTNVVDSFVNLLKPIMKSKSHLMQVHKTHEDLYKFVPKRMLPSDLGGDLNPYNILYEEYRKKIKLNRDWFVAEQKLRVNESLRPGIQKNARDIFGVEGSFRQINID